MEALMATLMVFQRKDQKWLWHLEADNGDIVATDGGQGYDNYVEAQAMADKVVIHGGFKTAERLQRPLPEA